MKYGISQRVDTITALAELSTTQIAKPAIGQVLASTAM